MTAAVAIMTVTKTPPRGCYHRGPDPRSRALSTDQITDHLCRCGCGRPTRPYRNTNATYGHVKGEFAPFLPGHAHRVKSLEERFWERVDVQGPDECWEWTAGRIAGGYGRINDLGRPLGAHRVSWEIENQTSVPEGLVVCHRCDNPPCCNPAHLFVGTTRDNAQDRDRKGRGLHGEANYCAKLTWDSVRSIRRRVDAGERQCDLAREYGVTRTTINDIVKGRSWRDF